MHPYSSDFWNVFFHGRLIPIFFAEVGIQVIVCFSPAYILLTQPTNYFLFLILLLLLSGKEGPK